MKRPWPEDSRDALFASTLEQREGKTRPNKNSDDFQIEFEIRQSSGRSTFDALNRGFDGLKIERIQEMPIAKLGVDLFVPAVFKEEEL